jgi:hypothetical protein
VANPQLGRPNPETARVELRELGICNARSLSNDEWDRGAARLELRELSWDHVANPQLGRPDPEMARVELRELGIWNARSLSNDEWDREAARLELREYGTAFRRPIPVISQ